MSGLFCCIYGRSDAHQSADAVLEEDNKRVKSWVSGMPDSNVWRSVVRHNNELANLRSVFFSSLPLTDPKSEAGARPPYDKELLAWRAQLRPFLVAPDGSVPNVRPL